MCKLFFIYYFVWYFNFKEHFRLSRRTCEKIINLFIQSKYIIKVPIQVHKMVKGLHGVLSLQASLSNSLPSLLYNDRL